MIRTILLHIGNELLRGETINTNASTISRILFESGYPVLRQLVVSDTPYDIQKALLDSCAEADFVICTGGLGPTTDDLTAEAAAQAFGMPLKENPKAWKMVQDRFAFLGRDPTGKDRKQALLPEGSVVLENAWGTAPGFYVRHKSATAFFLPGVPREMEPMLNMHVLSVMRTSKPPKEEIHSLSLLVFGIREARMNEILDPVIREFSDLQVAFLPRYPDITLRLTGIGVPPERIKTAADGIRKRLGTHIVGEGETTIEGTVAKLLREKGLTMAVAESCTGGLIAKRLTDIPGSSEYFERGIVSYSNESKIKALGVSADILAEHGSVSRETASEMARRIRFLSGTRIGLSVTGIAGPTGGSPEKPLGLVYIGLCTGDEPSVVEHRLKGTREQIRLLASSLALDLLRRYLLGSGDVVK
ncbi:MAG: competence/damage-inducible protein A [Nitrospirae bacterium]|nr:competence/damage-inducible protein A [Nitrospirota bacterium]